MAAQPVRQPDPRILRAVARYLEDDVLAVLISYADITFPPAVGNLQYFPRAAPDDQAAARGREVLESQIVDAVAALYALAVAIERNLPVPPVLLVSLQPYIDAGRAVIGIEADQPAAAPAQHSAAAETIDREDEKPASLTD